MQGNCLRQSIRRDLNPSFAILFLVWSFCGLGLSPHSRHIGPMGGSEWFERINRFIASSETFSIAAFIRLLPLPRIVALSFSQACCYQRTGKRTGSRDLTTH